MKKIQSLRSNRRFKIVDQNNARRWLKFEEEFKTIDDLNLQTHFLTDGGRAGFKLGIGPDKMISTNCRTTIQESPAQDLSYTELRSRLPQEYIK